MMESARQLGYIDSYYRSELEPPCIMTFNGTLEDDGWGGSWKIPAYSVQRHSVVVTEHVECLGEDYYKVKDSNHGLVKVFESQMPKGRYYRVDIQKDEHEAE